jgi:pimeloyl-ACP methyl ester carboxylesterase
MRQLVRELKRRHVYKVAVTYAAVAFVTLQAARPIFPSTTLEGLFDELVVLAFVGLPIALVISWASELTPEGVRQSVCLRSRKRLGLSRNTCLMTRSIPPFAAVVAAIASAVLLGSMASPVAAQAPSPRMVEVEGDSMRVMTAGFEHLAEGQPVVVFESGAGTSIDTWDPVFTDVAAFAPVVAYERRGIGKSEWDGQRPTPDRVIGQLQALLAELEAPPPYVLVGHSWGGWLIRHFAGRYPDEVAGLVYVDPTDFTQSRAERLAALREIGVAEAEAALEAWDQQRRSKASKAPPGVGATLAVVDSLWRKMEPGERSLLPPPDVPVAVLLGTRYPGFPPPGIEVEFDFGDYVEVMMRQRVRKMSGWALEAPEGLFVVSSRASHFVHHDVPGLVIDAIRHVLFPGVPRQLRDALAEGGREAMADTYRALKRRYPSDRFDEALLNQLGYELLRAEQVEDAIAIFELNVEEYPEAPNPYDSLGDAYRAAGRLEEAKRQYERAVALAEEQDHPSLETYRANLEQVTQQLAEKK